MSDFEHASFDDDGNLSLDIAMFKDADTGKSLWFAVVKIPDHTENAYDSFVVDKSHVSIDKDGKLRIRGAFIELDNCTIIQKGIVFENCSLVRTRLVDCRLINCSCRKCAIESCVATGSFTAANSILTSINTTGNLFVDWCTLINCTIEDMHDGYLSNSMCNYCCFKNVTVPNLNPGGKMIFPTFIDTETGLDGCVVQSLGADDDDSAISLRSILGAISDDIGIYHLQDCVKHTDLNSVSDYIFNKNAGVLDRESIESALGRKDVLVGSVVVFYFIDGSYMTAVLDGHTNTIDQALAELKLRDEEIKRNIAAELEAKIRALVGNDTFNQVYSVMPVNKRWDFIMYISTDNSEFSKIVKDIASEKPAGADSSGNLDPFDPSSGGGTTQGAGSILDKALNNLNNMDQSTAQTVLAELHGGLVKSGDSFEKDGFSRDSQTGTKQHTNDQGEICGVYTVSCINCQVSCYGGTALDDAGNKHKCEGNDVGWYVSVACGRSATDCFTRDKLTVCIGF